MWSSARAAIQHSPAVRWAARQVRQAANAAVDACVPPHCLACHARTQVQGLFCAACYRDVTLIGPPMCACCGLPFASAEAAGPDMLCERCRAAPRAFGRARAALLYTDGIKPVLLSFKHTDRTINARPLARLMLHAGRQLLHDCDLVAPVPLHRFRLVARRYNQAALLAWHLCQMARRPYVPLLLKRARKTPPLGDLPAAERARILEGAIVVRQPQRAEGRRVLLVDDVLTSGATAEACAKALLAAGALSVDVLAAARVPLGKE